MQDKVDKIIDKIVNSKALTQKQMETIYTQEEIKEMEERFNAEPQLSKEEQEEYNKIIFKEEMELYDRIKNLEKDKQNQIFEIVKKLEKNITNTPKQKKTIGIKNDKLDEHFEKYLKYKKDFYKVSNSSIKNYKAAYKYLKYFVKPSTELNFSFFKRFQNNLQRLPKSFFKYKKYYEKSFTEVIKLKNREGYETLDAKTINNHITSLKSFFDYLQYEEIIKENPITKIKPLPESKEIKKEEYSKEELNKILNSNMEKEYINMCKVALYTGFRIEEVLSIKKENFKDNLIYLDLQDSSSKKHKRIMPVHPNIKAIIEYQIKNNKGEYLFFDGNSKDKVRNVGKRINRRLKKIVNSPTKSFHSFRKNFSQAIELDTTAEEKVKKYLMGHSFSKDITHIVYNRGKVNIEKLQDCINQITFSF